MHSLRIGDETGTHTVYFAGLASDWNSPSRDRSRYVRSRRIESRGVVARRSRGSIDSDVLGSTPSPWQGEGWGEGRGASDSARRGAWRAFERFNPHPTVVPATVRETRRMITLMPEPAGHGLA